MKRLLLGLLVFAGLFSLSFSQTETPFFKIKYDPKANSETQLQNAITLAKESGKNILLDVGGEWCIWCHRLDSLFEANNTLAEFVLQNYVPVKIDVSKGHSNEEFLSRFPKIGGYPHLFVLDSNGKFLHSQDTGDLEEGKHHSPDKVMAFLKLWAPKKTHN